MTAMLSHQSDDGAGAASLEHLWQGIHAVLESERRRIYEEIKHYPRPIPACDVEFNHLLQERATILQELAKMGDCSTEGLRVDFIRLSRCLPEPERERILSCLSGPGT